MKEPEEVEVTEELRNKETGGKTILVDPSGSAILDMEGQGGSCKRTHPDVTFAHLVKVSL